jgi:diamine N-acetyltransferase
MAVSLEPITENNVGAVFDLTVEPEQAPFVAPNPLSLAQALAQYETAWPRAVVADGEVVGFLMLEIDAESEYGTPFYLWRLMVDRQHQRRGYGRAAVALAVDEVRSRGGSELHTSWVEGDHGPEQFYRNLGFEPTGEIVDDEVVALFRIA